MQPSSLLVSTPCVSEKRSGEPTPIKSPSLEVRVQGEMACFSRPEAKTERLSYEVMTPSAARGILEAILWKPAIRWGIEYIAVLKPIRVFTFRRNEINTKASAPAASNSLVRKGGAPPYLVIEERRSQRNMVALYDVEYIIRAHFSMTDRAGAKDNVAKFVDMFRRRVAKGQAWHHPYLGCREFPAKVFPVETEWKAEPLNRDLGIMLWDIDYGPKENRPIFFRARLTDGILHVPEDPESTFQEVA